MRLTPEYIVHNLSTVIDATLADLIVTSYSNMQQRYYAGDWMPSELNGGKFCEAIVRAIYQLDSSTLDNKSSLGEICNKLLDTKATHLLNEKDRKHFCRVLQTTFNFRNDRDVAHLSWVHTANHIDALLIVAEVKWLFADFLRLAWKSHPSEIVAAIESIVQFEHPLIHELDGKPLVLSNNLTVAQEILIQLLNSPTGSLKRSELQEYIPASASGISKALKSLTESRQIRRNEAGDIAITPSGQKRVYEEIIPKLSVTAGV